MFFLIGAAMIVWGIANLGSEQGPLFPMLVSMAGVIVIDILGGVV